MTFEFTTIGNSSALPAYDRLPSAHLLNYNETYHLLDCGEGTQIKLPELGLKKSKIEHIFISHLHGDHYFGLPGLLTSLNLLGHEKPITVYAFEELEQILNLQMKVSGLQFKFPLHFKHLSTQHKQLILDNANFRVYSLPLKHRIPCCGFLFEEKPKQRKFLPEKIKQYSIPVEVINDIKAGADFTTSDGQVIPNKELTVPPEPPRKFAYITDTLYLEDLANELEGCDTIYHEATFKHEAAQRAEVTFHTTATQAATLAKNAHAGQLLLGHFSAKYRDLSSLLEEAREIFKNTFLTEAGAMFPVNGTTSQR